MKIPENLRDLRTFASEKSVALSAFLGVLAWYLPTLAHHLPGGDAGDLATAACQTTVAHPPGYPLWVLIAKSALLIPYGSPIWRLSLMSALHGSATAALIAAVLWRVGIFWPLTLLGAALFSFTSNVWFFAVTPEVFSLNSFLVMLAFYAAIRADQQQTWHWRFVSGLALGLGFANHHTSLALCGPLALVSLTKARSPGEFLRGGSVMAGGLLVGLLPYAYLPLAALSQSIYSWSDPTTFGGFWHHVLRADYGTFRLSSGSSTVSLGHNLGLYGTYLMKESFTLAPILMLLGLYGLCTSASRRQNPLLWGMLATCLYLVVFHAAANLYFEYDLHRQVLSRFWIMPQLVVVMVSMIGLDVVARWCGGRLQTPLMVLSLVAIVLIPFTRRVHVDISNDDTIEQFARADFAAMPEGSMALLRNDLSFPIVYLQACQGVRPDVHLINRAFLTREWSREKVLRAYPDVILPAGTYDPKAGPKAADVYNLTDLIEQNIDRHPILLHEFAPGSAEYEEVRGWTGRFDVLPWGMLTRVVRHDPVRDFRRLDETNKRLLALFVPPSDNGSPDRWDSVVRMVYVDALYLRAMYLTQAQLIDPTLFPLALTAIHEASVLPDQSMSRLYSTLGFAYAIEERRDPAARAGAIDAWQNYLKVAPEGDPGRAQIEERLSRMLGMP